MSQRTKLLIVDDEPALLRMLAMYLDRLGYEVTQAIDCTSTEEAVRAAIAPFQLLIADLTLPDGAGDELAVRIARQYPDIHVLLSSGFPVDLESIPADVRPRFAFLQKPFVPSALAEAVRALTGN